MRLLWSRTTLRSAHLANVLAHLLLIRTVQRHHGLAREVQRERRGQQRQQSDLHGGVVEHLVLASLPFLGIPVLELPTYRGIAGCDCYTTGEDTTGLHNDRGTDPCQGAVNEGSGCRAFVLVCLEVDAGELCQHANVRDFDVVEEEVAVVHRVVAELGADIANVDVLQRLVGLEVPDMYDEGMRAVWLPTDDQLCHYDSIVGCAA